MQMDIVLPGHGGLFDPDRRRLTMINLIHSAPWLMQWA
jgi:hypothetical protein